MSLQDFWVSVRTGAGMVAPRAIVDSPELDPEAIERTLRGATLWLSPSAVAGFEEADFDFLPEEERGHLSDLVRQFREVARSVDPRGPASQEAVDQALPLFLGIVERLDFRRYEDPEAYRLGKLIEREIGDQRLPGLAELRFRTGRDQTGDPGLWIWAFLDDRTSEDDERFVATARQLWSELGAIARRVCPERFPYISFRSLAEESKPVEA